MGTGTADNSGEHQQVLVATLRERILALKRPYPKRVGAEYELAYAHNNALDQAAACVTPLDEAAGDLAKALAKMLGPAITHRKGCLVNSGSAVCQCGYHARVNAVIDEGRAAIAKAGQGSGS